VSSGTGSSVANLTDVSGSFTSSQDSHDPDKTKSVTQNEHVLPLRGVPRGLYHIDEVYLSLETEGRKEIWVPTFHFAVLVMVCIVPFYQTLYSWCLYESFMHVGGIAWLLVAMPMFVPILVGVPFLILFFCFESQIVDLGTVRPLWWYNRNDGQYLGQIADINAQCLAECTTVDCKENKAEYFDGKLQELGQDVIKDELRKRTWWNFCFIRTSIQKKQTQGEDTQNKSHNRLFSLVSDPDCVNTGSKELSKYYHGEMKQSPNFLAIVSDRERWNVPKQMLKDLSPGGVVSHVKVTLPDIAATVIVTLFTLIVGAVLFDNFRDSRSTFLNSVVIASIFSFVPWLLQYFSRRDLRSTVSGRTLLWKGLRLTWCYFVVMRFTPLVMMAFFEQYDGIKNRILVEKLGLNDSVAHLVILGLANWLLQPFLSRVASLFGFGFLGRVRAPEYQETSKRATFGRRQSVTGYHPERPAMDSFDMTAFGDVHGESEDEDRKKKRKKKRRMRKETLTTLKGKASTNLAKRYQKRPKNTQRRDRGLQRLGERGKATSSTSESSEATTPDGKDAAFHVANADRSTPRRSPYLKERVAQNHDAVKILRTVIFALVDLLTSDDDISSDDDTSSDDDGSSDDDISSDVDIHNNSSSQDSNSSEGSGRHVKSRVENGQDVTNLTPRTTRSLDSDAQNADAPLKLSEGEHEMSEKNSVVPAGDGNSLSKTGLFYGRISGFDSGLGRGYRTRDRFFGEILFINMGVVLVSIRVMVSRFLIVKSNSLVVLFLSVLKDILFLLVQYVLSFHTEYQVLLAQLFAQTYSEEPAAEDCGDVEVAVRVLKKHTALVNRLNLTPSTRFAVAFLRIIDDFWLLPRDMLYVLPDIVRYTPADVYNFRAEASHQGLVLNPTMRAERCLDQLYGVPPYFRPSDEKFVTDELRHTLQIRWGIETMLITNLPQVDVKGNVSAPRSILVHDDAQILETRNEEQDNVRDQVLASVLRKHSVDSHDKLRQVLATKKKKQRTKDAGIVTPDTTSVDVANFDTLPMDSLWSSMNEEEKKNVNTLYNEIVGREHPSSHDAEGKDSNREKQEKLTTKKVKGSPNRAFLFGESIDFTLMVALTQAKIHRSFLIRAYSKLFAVLTLVCVSLFLPFKDYGYWNCSEDEDGALTCDRSQATEKYPDGRILPPRYAAAVEYPDPNTNTWTMIFVFLVQDVLELVLVNLHHRKSAHWWFIDHFCNAPWAMGPLCGPKGEKVGYWNSWHIRVAPFLLLFCNLYFLTGWVRFLNLHGVN